MTHFEFSDLLDQALAAQDRSGAWLAQRIGVNPATVSRWRNGDSRPGGPDVVQRIADLLGIHGDERGRLLAAAGYGVVEVRSETPTASAAPPVAATPVAATPAAAISTAAISTGMLATPVPAQIASPWLDFPATYCQAEMATLAQWLDMGASGIVVGAAGSGVSNLLRYFSSRPDALAAYRSGTKSIMPIWIELQPMVEPIPATIYRLFLRGLLAQVHHQSLALPAALLQSSRQQLHSTDTFTLQTTLFDLLAHFQAVNVGLVFVFDRIDPLAPAVQLDVANNLRAVRDHFRETISYVMGMRNSPTYPENIYTLGDLGRLLSTHICTVGALTDQDSFFTIARRTRGAGITPSGSEIEQMLALSGGYPMLLKTVVQWWLAQRSRLPENEWQAALLREPGVQLQLREIGACLSEEEQDALRTLIAAQHATSVASQSPLMPYAVGERLSVLGICRRHEQGWQLRGTLFAGIF